jgi:LysR family transcriptional regulator, hydrogen peroxide-inducible genes activator
MQMQQVRYFLALCELRSFTKAARRCDVSQPALTNAITALEREVGGVLFQRRPSVALTGRGHAIQPYLQRIVENAGLAVQAARTFAEELR